jgi:hypothetical protein
VLGDIFTHNKLTANNAMSLGVPTALKVPGLPKSAHLVAHGRDDVVTMGIFVRLDPLLCQLQAIVFALEVNQIISKVSE